MSEQKFAIVSGASSGIGRAAAEALLNAGWVVGLVARREALLAEIAEKHDKAIALPGDVTEPGDVEAAVGQFVTQTNRIDLLFNNAGIFSPQKPVDEVSVEEWTRAVSVNLTGMFLMARACFGQMRRQQQPGGRIINNGSISAHSPREGAVCYTATKHAITGLTKSISLDGRPFDIACGQIDIGNAHTELVDTLVQAAEAQGNPPPPTMDVSHVAEAVLAMAELPPDANVQFMTIMATKMPFVGRG